MIGDNPLTIAAINGDFDYTGTDTSVYDAIDFLPGSTGTALNRTVIFDADAANNLDFINFAPAATDVATISFRLDNGATLDLSAVAITNFSANDTIEIRNFDTIYNGPASMVTGTVFSDNIIGGQRTFDTLNGGGGDDNIDGGYGGAVISGGEGNDTIDGGYNGSGTINGDAGNDSIRASYTGGDVFGGIGNDTIRGGQHITDIFGGEGNDSLSGGYGGGEIHGNSGDDVIRGGFSVSDLYGNTGNDTISGGYSGGTVYGGNGNDMLNGSYLGGTVYGGNDDDVIRGGYQGGTLYGEDGNDLITAGYLGAVIFGGDGDDTLRGGSRGDSWIEGGAGADQIIGRNNGTDTASYASSAGFVNVSLLTGFMGGGAGSHAIGDTLANIGNLIGSAFDDRLNGDSNDNLLQGGAGADFYNGNGGFDVVGYQTSTSFVNVSLATGYTGGGVDNDATGDTFLLIEGLIGSAFDDRLNGDNGSNLLEGGKGADVLNGNAGNDTISYASSESFVNVSLATGYTGGGVDNDATGDTFSSIENLTGSMHDDSLSTDNNDNLLMGLAGADTLNGRGGEDTVSFAGSDTGNEANLLTGVGGGNTSSDSFGDVYIGIEHLIGGENNDTLIGNAGNNTLLGGGNSDILEGGAGDDILHGGEDRDVLRGGVGDDVLRGEDGRDVLEGGAGADVLDGGGDYGDTASYESSAGFVNVSLATGFAGGGAGTHAAGDTFIGIANLRGSDFDDRLRGNDENNFLDGGLGADRLDGSDGYDYADYERSESYVNVSLKTGYTGGGVDNHASGDTFFNIEGIYGSDFDDLLSGDSGDNHLSGNDGDDILVGREGADRLYGGGGNDTASYFDSSSGVNVSLQTGYTGTGATNHATGDRFSSIENLSGSAFNDVLSGNTRDNIINGLGGNDTLRSYAGADQFKFDTGFGNDVVADFEDGVDMLNFVDHAGVTSFADLTITTSGSAALVADGAGNTVLVNGLAGNLTVDDFIF
ncbi:calcium-binding protein [uncultured Sulfitobacter sp.]|uniref:beta strand repeat-containing protein n=1 Tax=uncultured Sulfitobacter sp. TaxID=191468 RepID=UPI002633C277|nr:calcium-binding protein [uncultured Sulfitobacter sp.]